MEPEMSSTRTIARVCLGLFFRSSGDHRQDLFQCRVTIPAGRERVVAADHDQPAAIVADESLQGLHPRLGQGRGRHVGEDDQVVSGKRAGGQFRLDFDLDILAGQGLLEMFGQRRLAFDQQHPRRRIDIDGTGRRDIAGHVGLIGFDAYRNRRRATA